MHVLCTRGINNTKDRINCLIRRFSKLTIEIESLYICIIFEYKLVLVNQLFFLFSMFDKVTTSILIVRI